VEWLARKVKFAQRAYVSWNARPVKWPAKEDVLFWTLHDSIAVRAATRAKAVKCVPKEAVS
jgi:hypothetical protein